MPSALPYRPVRALNRGLAILEELNRLGTARVAVLAQATGIDRTTSYRLLATLEEFGLVRESAASGEYVLTERVRALSEGFTERDRATQIVSAHLGRLFPQVLWPTDFAVFDRGAMVIRETTHRFSPYSVHRAMVGQPRPLLTSALGRAALAGASPRDRTTMLDIARGARTGTDESIRWIEEQVDILLSDYARHGYSRSISGPDDTISAIAVAVAVRGGAAAAAINLVFFRSAMSIETAAARHLDALTSCAKQIEESLSRGDLV